jgi:polyisoprenyl-phosphate glycosyltransferase
VKSAGVISVVIPVFKSPSSLVELHFRLVQTLTKITDGYEIIFVNDASPMNDWEIIKEIAIKDKNVKGMNLSRNFGQHCAITAGLEISSGDSIIVMDCDLQDKPEEIINLYNEYVKDFDIVVGSRESRKDLLIKKLLSQLFYKALSYLTDTAQDSSVGNFGIYSRNVINAVLSMKDDRKYFPTMIKWVGFRKSIIRIKHSQRKYGKTSYKLKDLINLALNTIISFSDKPLRLVVNLGLFVSISAILFGLFNLLRYFRGEILVSGWVSIIVSIWFLSGIIIFVLGIIGLYTGRIFEKSKDRPVYIIKEKIN